MDSGAAFFDLDHTILRHDSVLGLTLYMFRLGHVGYRDLARTGIAFGRYRLGVLDIEATARQVISEMIGKPEAPFRDSAERFFREHVRNWIRPEARRAVEQERSAGRSTVLLTGGLQFVADRVGSELGFETVICSRVEVSDGIFVSPPPSGPSVGRGKVTAARGFADKTGVRLDRSSAYGDSYADVHLLSSVAEPVAVNPDRKLRRTARQRGWRIVEWN